MSPPRTQVLAGGDDLCDVRVAGGHELPPQILRRQRRALLEVERAGGEIFDRRQTIERRGDRHDHDIECPLHELVERREPFGNEIVMRRELVVRQRFPIRE